MLVTFYRQLGHFLSKNSCKYKLSHFQSKYSRKYRWCSIDAFLSTIKQKRHYKMAYQILQKHITWHRPIKKKKKKHITWHFCVQCRDSCGISSLHWYRSSVRKPLYNYRKIYLKPNWCPLNFPGLEKVIAIFHLYICRRLNNHFPCPIFISDQPSLPCSPPGATTHPPHNKYCK